MVRVRGWQKEDLPDMVRIWNEVVRDGIAFPQEEELDEESGRAFFEAQSHCGVAVITPDGEGSEGDDALGASGEGLLGEAASHIAGLYILHPNNVGRCGHIANASYAVEGTSRGEHIGEQLVLNSLKEAKVRGFRVMQFNAVVKTNMHARHLYERIGFKPLGEIPGGFRMKDGHYETICPYCFDLETLGE